MNETEKQRLYRKAYERMEKRYQGGGACSFGHDWRTLKIELPGWYATLAAIVAIKPQ
jgi:hypothetical protein